MNRAAYIEECRRRWYGPAFKDACRNWHHFRSIHLALEEAMRTFRRDPFLEDLHGKQHNPDGTLTAFLWKLQESLQPDPSCLGPLLDFEEGYQKVFLRRGLIPYCHQVLGSLVSKVEAPLLDHVTGWKEGA